MNPEIHWPVDPLRGMRDEVLREFWGKAEAPHASVWIAMQRMADEIDRLRKELERADTASAILREVIEEQRQRLTAVEAERDALRQQLAVVGVAAHGGTINDVPREYRTDASDKVEKLERILAALREPSEAVVEAGCIARFGPQNWALSGDGEDDWRKTSRLIVGQQLMAAIAAAEREVDGE